MNELEHDVLGTLRRSRVGSVATQANRRDLAMRFASRLGEQFRGLRLANIRKDHVDWYVGYLTTMRSERTGMMLEPGTQKNSLAAVRWLLQCIGKPNLLPKTNNKLGIKRRVYVTNLSKSINVIDAEIGEIQHHCEYAASAILLSREFGLRIEESFKIIPMIADEGSVLRLQRSWTKGGVPRTIPILQDSQRRALRRVREVAGDDSLIPRGLNYVTHLLLSRSLYNKFGIHHNHGLRHQYAQVRFRELAGFDCPALGGPMRGDMTDEQYRTDRKVRKIISGELGHGRVAVTSVFLGSPTLKSIATTHQVDRLLGDA